MKILNQQIADFSLITIDFSGVDISGLDRGDRVAITALIDFFGKIAKIIDEFPKASPEKRPILVAWGFPSSGLSPAAELAVDELNPRAWFLDELIDTRQSLREAFLRSRIWSVPSIYLGSTDCTSPALEIMSLFQSRLWLNEHNFFYGMPSHWSYDLLHNDPFFGSYGISETVAHGWQLSVESAQKTGMVDSSFSIPGFFDNPFDHLAPLVDRLAPALMARVRAEEGPLHKLGDKAFRLALATAVRHFKSSANNGARSLFKSLNAESFSPAEREVARAFRCLNGERERSVRSRQKSPQVFPVYSPQMFGFFADLAGEVMPAELLTAAVARKGLVFLTSSDPGVLSARLDQQRQRLVSLLGNAKAQVFWERNVIPLAGGKGFFDEASALPVIVPRSASENDSSRTGSVDWTITVPAEGSFRLTLLPQMALRARSDEAFSGLVVGELTGDIDCWSDLSVVPSGFPELISILRALVDGVLLKPAIRSVQIRELFHVMLAGYLNSIGAHIDAVWPVLVESGWSLDNPASVRLALAQVFKGLSETHDSKSSREKMSRDKGAPVFANHVAWALLSVLQDRLAGNGVARELIRDIVGAPCTMLVGVEGDEAVPTIHQLQMIGSPKQEAFLSFVPWPASERWHRKPGRQAEYPVGVGVRQRAVKAQVCQFVSALTRLSDPAVCELPQLLSVLAPQSCGSPR